MIKNRNIVCISSIDWDFIWQGHQEIMSTFARNNNKVLFIENTGVRSPGINDLSRIKKRLTNWFASLKGFREENRNLFIYSPLVLPFQYSRIARLINKFMLLKPLKRWMRVMEFNEPIVWTFLPTGIAYDIINNIDPSLVVYYCIADFYKLVNKPSKVKKTEDELIKRCDVIFAQGAVLKSRCERLNNNVHIFPFGVRMKSFESGARSADTLPEDIRKAKRPIVGYVGGVHKHIDFGLVKYLAQNNPTYTIALVGPLQTNISAFRDEKNILLLGKKDFDELPSYIKEFDVCIIPYRLNEYTETVFPTKLNEYHALGKPVVSTHLPEVINYNRENNDLVLLANTNVEFNRRIQEALNTNGDGIIRKRIESAKANDWGSRIDSMSAIMEKKIIDNEKERTIHWKDNFLRVYKKTKKKIISAFLSFFITYFVIFYTPLVWYLAEPLKVAEPLESADAIVVFAGGVGESGKAGQGYEERVKYSAELYKRGLASRLIYSSGYMYVFKEPLVMKALALSLGIPEEAIVLEEKAQNTVQNVHFSAEIVRANKWKKIILVSSPYHMRRASLVFDKNASDIEVVYAPLPGSQFYAHNKTGTITEKRVNSRQIRAICHEYVAIVYYWLKGYI